MVLRKDFVLTKKLETPEKIANTFVCIFKEKPEKSYKVS
jgi:hypothetical protein